MYTIMYKCLLCDEKCVYWGENHNTTTIVCDRCHSPYETMGELKQKLMDKYKSPIIYKRSV